MKTQRNKTKLVQYYQQELDDLRTEAATFAGQHPGIAQTLGLGHGVSPDPHIELLQQSFAFFSGRLRHHVEVDKARIPNALAESLYPHLGAPVPSMLIAQMSNVAEAATLKRGQGFVAQAKASNDQQLDCQLRSCYETPLLPMSIKKMITLTPAKEALPQLGRRKPAKLGAVLKVHLEREPLAATAVLGPGERLRFYIDTEAVPMAWRLYEMLRLQLEGMVLTLPRDDGGPSLVLQLETEQVRWLGYDDAEAVLMHRDHTAPAYRLLQEYFAFPHKFLFFEIAGLDLSALQTRAELQFLLREPVERREEFPVAALQLNCVPLVNLFVQHIEPMSIDHTEIEYRLVADLEQHRHHEIYALEKLYSIRGDGSMRNIAPYFAADELSGSMRPDYFYLGRRERSEATDVPGGEYFVSFLDEELNLTQLEDEIIGGTAQCTNRRLPEQIRVGTELQFEGPSLKMRVNTLSRPTAHHMPAQIGQRPWQLVSQLALNRLSLAEGPAARNALKQILSLHVGPQRVLGLRQIAGILDLSCKQIMRHRDFQGRRGFVRTTQVHVKLDRYEFVGASPVLFWTVLRHFFSLYATVNQLVECTFETDDEDIQGRDSGWEPMGGAKWVI
jgi:type VI secretion system protein ImpG